MVDAEIEKLRQSVIPIVSADGRRRPYLVGSAVALIYRERKLLVTAEHVFSDNEGVPLLFFCSTGYSRPLTTDEFEYSNDDDLAVVPLLPEDCDALSHVPFLAETDLGSIAPVGESFYASVAGYPATAAKRRDGVTFETPMEVYSNFAAQHSDGSISVRFDRKEGGVSKAGHVNLAEPYGKSGGAIFGVAVNGSNVRPQQTAKLVGIATDWKRSERNIRGASVDALIPLLDYSLRKATQGKVP